MAYLKQLSIVDADFGLKKRPRLAFPGSSQLLVVHEMNLQGIVLQYEVRLSRIRGGGWAVWQTVYDGGDKTSAIGRLFRSPDDLSEEAALRALTRVLVRARWPYEVAGRAIASGMITEMQWNSEVDAFDAEHEAATEEARRANERSPSGLLATAQALRLNPQPAGEKPHQWTARCPRGNHPIFISTTTDTFACPWCRQKGGSDVLLAFAATHGLVPSPSAAAAVVMPSSTIDWEFRPATYFGPRSRREKLIGRVSNAVLREELERLMAAGDLEAVDDLLGPDGISRDLVHELGTIHPELLGGTYLPPLETGEVEIARVRLASVTFDVVGIYARPDGDEIRLRVVDEYDGDTLRGKRELRLGEPLSLRQLVDFFLTAWPLDEIIQKNGTEVDFSSYVHAQSHFYPQWAEALGERLKSDH